MNRKLHNSFTALAVSAAALTLGLLAAAPMPDSSQASVPVRLGMLDLTYAPAAATESRALVHDAEALAQRIEQRAAGIDTLAEATAFTAELAVTAALAGSLPGAGTADPTVAEAEKKQARTASRHRRQTHVMPYFSFAPRG